MMNNKTVFWGLCFVVILNLIGTVKMNGQVKYSNEFLKIGVDARIMGMGSAGIANATGAEAGYWNPAGLAKLPGRFDAGIMHSEYFAGLAKYDYGSVAYRIDDQSTAGLSFIRFGIDDIPNTLELIDADGNIRYDRIRTFSAADVAVLLSYGRLMPLEGLSVGGNVKIIHRRTGDFANAWGFGIDLGANYHIQAWEFALMLRDVTSTFNAWRFNTESLEKVFELTGNEIPENSIEVTLPSLILGSSRTFAINEKVKASAMLDLHFNLDGKRPVLLPLGFTGIDPFLGTEWSYNNWLFIRAGVGQFQWVTGFSGTKELNLQPSLGLGLVFKNIRLNYAITDLGDLSIAQYSNIISLHYGI